MIEPITPQHLQPILRNFMLESLELRLHQVEDVVTRVSQTNFHNAEEAFEVMSMTCWQLEWIGYAGELEENEAVEMVDLYRFLSRWRLRWAKLEKDSTLKLQVSDEAREWVKKVRGWASLDIQKTN
jgi:hypothetical protein